MEKKEKSPFLLLGVTTYDSAETIVERADDLFFDEDTELLDVAKESICNPKSRLKELFNWYSDVPKKTQIDIIHAQKNGNDFPLDDLSPLSEVQFIRDYRLEKDITNIDSFTDLFSRLDTAMSKLTPDYLTECLQHQSRFNKFTLPTSLDIQSCLFDFNREVALSLYKSVINSNSRDTLAFIVANNCTVREYTLQTYIQYFFDEYKTGIESEITEISKDNDFLVTSITKRKNEYEKSKPDNMLVNYDDSQIACNVLRELCNEMLYKIAPIYRIEERINDLHKLIAC